MTNKAKSAQHVPAVVGVGTAWLASSPVFGFGDGKLLVDGKAYNPHQGGILGLIVAPQSGLIVTCGEDGAVIGTDINGVSTKLFDDPKAWLDALACHDQTGQLAICAGRDVIMLDLKNATSPLQTRAAQTHAAQTRAAQTEPVQTQPPRIQPARAPTSIAFSGDGTLLAVGHSGGVSLFKVSQPGTVWHEFPATGGPLSVALDQSGDFLFAGLSEPALAGWRLSDGQGFRMGGYPGKPRQLVWNSNGKALLTTGGPALLVWPMTAKDGQTIAGPMGQAAGVYRPRLGMMTAVATAGDYAATGWSDGGVDLVNLVDGTTRHIGGPRPPKDLTRDPRALTTSIVSLAFRGDGKQVSWIGETGAYGTAAIQ